MQEQPKPYYVFRHAAQALTFRSGPYAGRYQPRPGDVLKNATLVAHRGRIVWLGPDSEYDPDAYVDHPRVEFDLSGQIILPGLVDPHTHLLYGGHRVQDWLHRFQGLSYAEITRRGGGIRRTVAATRKTRDDALRTALLKRLDRLFASGVTTVEIKTGYGLRERDEFRMLRLLQVADQAHPVTIIPTFLPAHAPPDDGDRNEFLQVVREEWIPRVGRDHSARYCDVFCDEGFFTVEETLELVRAAREANLAVRLHCDELSSTGLIERMNDWRGVHALDHLDHMNPDAAAILAENEIAAVLLPATCLHMGLPDPPIPAMLDQGVILALGSDHNPGTNPVLNPWYTLWLACTKWHLAPLQALAGMTVNAAYTFRMHGRLGRLQPGLRADFIAVDVPHYGFLLYQWDLVPVTYVVKNGRPYRVREDARIYHTYRRYEPEGDD